MKAKLPQIVERRVAGAKVVDRYSYAIRAKMFECCWSVIEVIHQGGFSQFQFQPMRLKTCLVQNTKNGLRELLLPELSSGEIDCHPYRWNSCPLPSGILLACRTQ